LGCTHLCGPPPPTHSAVFFTDSRRGWLPPTLPFPERSIAPQHPCHGRENHPWAFTSTPVASCSCCSGRHNGRPSDTDPQQCAIERPCRPNGGREATRGGKGSKFCDVHGTWTPHLRPLQSTLCRPSPLRASLSHLRTRNDPMPRPSDFSEPDRPRERGFAAQGSPVLAPCDWWFPMGSSFMCAA
jgi:hypothetical protein